MVTETRNRVTEEELDLLMEAHARKQATLQQARISRSKARHPRALERGPRSRNHPLAAATAISRCLSNDAPVLHLQACQSFCGRGGPTISWA